MTVEQLTARAEALAADVTIEAADKAQIADLYRQAVTSLEASAGHARRTAEFQHRRQAAAAQVEAAKAKLGLPESILPLEISAEAELTEWQQHLADATSELDAARDNLTQAQDEPRRRAERRSELAQRLSSLRQELATPADNISGDDPAMEMTPLMQAQADQSAAHRLEVECEIAAGEAELAWFDAAAELLPLDRDLAARRVVQLEKLVEQLREKTNQRRAEDAQRQEQLARRLAAHTNPLIKRQAEENHRLTLERQRVAEEIEQIQSELDRASKRLSGVRNDHKRITGRVEEAGLSNAVGSLLRRQCSTLPNVRKYRQKRRLRQAELANLQLHRYELEDQREPLAEIDVLANEILQQQGATVEDRHTWILRDTIRASLETRREVLDSLLTDYDSLHRLMVDLDTRQRELIDQTIVCRSYIDQRVLWIRSLPWVSSQDASSIAATARELTQPAAWQGVGRWLQADVQAHRGTWMLAGLLTGAGILLHRTLRRRLRQFGETAAAAYCERFTPTARAAALTVLLAGMGPAVFVFLSWRLTYTWPGEAFIRGVAAGLQTAAINYFFAELILKVCRPWGLAEAHFGWAPAELRALRSNMRWLAAIGVPVAFTITLTEIVADVPGMSPLGRLAFVIGQFALAVFAVRSLRAGQGVLRSFLATTSGQWFERARWFWYPLCVGLPLTLSLLALCGYYYTALRLAERLLLSMWLLAAVALACGLLWRWLLLARRVLAIKQARARRAALQPEAKETGEPLEISRVDLSSINAQSQQFLRAIMTMATVFGLWAVWVDVLPALGMLNGVAIWARGTENPITLAHLLVSLILIAMTAVAYRNLPGLLEISLLQRLPLDSGTRYAITSVSRYLIAIVGLVAAFEEIGVGWSKVQWFIAAMSVGLGFGLQEIFANFVSGLIILFERPVRVGDIVTVGDLTGNVTKIRIRATTLLNGDRKELVIPNRAFITERLINWTLSDTVSRLSITVEVAGGNDPEQVAQLLRSIAQAHPLVLAEPATVVTFERIGDGTMEFILRVCVASPDQLSSVRHELNSAILRQFHEQAIEIGKPQRDLHVRLLEQESAAAVPVRDAQRSAA